MKQKKSARKLYTFLNKREAIRKICNKTAVQLLVSHIVNCINHILLFSTIKINLLHVSNGDNAQQIANHI